MTMIVLPCPHCGSSLGIDSVPERLQVGDCVGVVVVDPIEDHPFMTKPCPFCGGSPFYYEGALKCHDCDTVFTWVEGGT